MTTQPNPKTAAMMGALVADAATLGHHWNYDPARIADVSGDTPAFTPIDAKNFEGVPAYFAHAAKQDGDLSQYGEVLSLAMRSIAGNSGFDVTLYQDAFAAHFGMGGSFHGYIDRPTRGTVENILADKRTPSGIDDDQHPAIATLPAIVARYHGATDFHAQVQNAVHVTNVNDTADHYTLIFADTLADVLSGTSLPDALKTAATREPLLQAALDTPEQGCVAYGEITGRPCRLPQGTPLAFHILSRTSSYQGAINANILAGGDNCGRAIMIGALAGAAYGIDAIPVEWMLATNNASALLTLSKKILN
jgi:hypothetical protein